MRTILCLEEVSCGKKRMLATLLLHILLASAIQGMMKMVPPLETAFPSRLCQSNEIYKVEIREGACEIIRGRGSNG